MARSTNVNVDEHASSQGKPSLVRRWLREPLLHFLLIGLALFALYRALNPEAIEPENRSRIELTDDDLRQLEVGWMAQWRRPPAPEEIRRLLDGKVREEILYREALALGLDQGDTIVKRRMAQKMEFLAEDVSDLREPNREELKAWFEKNALRFTIAGRVSFRHLYFSFDRRGERAREAAEGVLATLTGQPTDSPDATVLADPFMFQDSYGDRSPEQVANVFGAQFTRSVFQLEPGAWQGPIESGLGWHLVWVESVTPARVPAFEEVEPEVRSAWVAEQRAEFKRQAFEAMQARYQIVLPGAPAKAIAGNGTLPVKEAP
ncbi:MAG: peptidyl-prolyl cis-trans isomerase [Candidatus Entotheonellia bacterium]